MIKSFFLKIASFVAFFTLVSCTDPSSYSLDYNSTLDYEDQQFTYVHDLSKQENNITVLPTNSSIINLSNDNILFKKNLIVGVDYTIDAPKPIIDKELRVIRDQNNFAKAHLIFPEELKKTKLQDIEELKVDIKFKNSAFESATPNLNVEDITIGNLEHSFVVKYMPVNIILNAQLEYSNTDFKYVHNLTENEIAISPNDSFDINIKGKNVRFKDNLVLDEHYKITSKLIDKNDVQIEYNQADRKKISIKLPQSINNEKISKQILNQNRNNLKLNDFDFKIKFLNNSFEPIENEKNILEINSAQTDNIYQISYQVVDIPISKAALTFEEPKTFFYVKDLNNNITLTPNSTTKIKLNKQTNVTFKDTLVDGVDYQINYENTDYGNILISKDQTDNSHKTLLVTVDDSLYLDADKIFSANVIINKSAINFDPDNYFILYNSSNDYTFDYSLEKPESVEVSVTYDINYIIENHVDQDGNKEILEQDYTEIFVASDDEKIKLKDNLEANVDYTITSDNGYFIEENLRIDVAQNGLSATLNFFATNKEYLDDDLDNVSVTFLSSAFITDQQYTPELTGTTALYDAILTIDSLSCSIKGSTFDQLGAPLDSIKITSTDSEGATNVTNSDNSGTFILDDLACGLVTLDIEHPENSDMGIPHGLKIQREVELVLSDTAKEIDVVFYNNYERAIENSNNRASTTVTNFKKSGESFAWGDNHYRQLGIDFSLNNDCKFFVSGNFTCITSPKKLVNPSSDQYIIKRTTGSIHSHFLVSNSKTASSSNDLYFTGYSIEGFKGDTTFHDDGDYVTNNIEKVNKKSNDALFDLVSVELGTTLLGDNTTGLYSSGPGTDNGLFLGRDATKQDHFLMFSQNNNQRGDITSDNAKITQVAAGFDFVLYLSKDGILYSSGSNEFGQLGVDSVDVSHPNFKIDKNEFIDLHHKAIRVKDAPKDIVKIIAGVNTAGAITSKGELWLWGNNVYSQISNQNVEEIFRPQKMDFLGETKIKEAAIGDSIYVITDENKIYTWGKNGNGQLSHGFDSNYELSPMEITSSFSEDIEFLGSGLNHGIFQGINNIYTVGSNESGQLGDGTRNNRSSAYRVNLP